MPGLCFQRPALSATVSPAFLSLFGTVEGYFCEECAREIQRPYEEELRRSVAERAPQLTEDDLASLPNQMLKFTGDAADRIREWPVADSQMSMGMSPGRE